MPTFQELMDEDIRAALWVGDDIPGQTTLGDRRTPPPTFLDSQDFSGPPQKSFQQLMDETIAGDPGVQSYQSIESIATDPQFSEPRPQTLRPPSPELSQFDTQPAMTLPERAATGAVSGLLDLPKSFAATVEAASERQLARESKFTDVRPKQPVDTSIFQREGATGNFALNRHYLKNFHDDVIATNRVGRSSTEDGGFVEHTMLLSTFGIGDKTYILPTYNPETGREVADTEMGQWLVPFEQDIAAGKIGGYDTQEEAEAELQKIRDSIISPASPGFLEQASGFLDAAPDVLNAAFNPTAAFRMLIGQQEDMRPVHEQITEDLIGVVGAERVRDFARTSRETLNEAQRLIERRMSEEEMEELARLIVDPDLEEGGKRRLISLLKKKAELPPSFDEATFGEKAKSMTYWANTFPRQSGNILGFIIMTRLGARFGSLPGSIGSAAATSAIIEGGSHYNQRIQEGVDPTEAAKEAAQVAKVAAPITALTSGLTFGRLASATKPVTLTRVAGAVASETPEELGQMLSGNIFAGRDLFEGAADTFLLSTAFGLFQAGGVIKTGINARKFKQRVFDALEESGAEAILPIIRARGNPDLTPEQKDLMDNVFSDEEGSTYSQTVRRWAQKLGMKVEEIRGKSTPALERMIGGLRGRTGQPRIETDLRADEELQVEPTLEEEVEPTLEEEVEPTLEEEVEPTLEEEVEPTLEEEVEPTGLEALLLEDDPVATAANLDVPSARNILEELGDDPNHPNLRVALEKRLEPQPEAAVEPPTPSLPVGIPEKAAQEASETAVDTTPASSLPVVGKVTLAEKYAQPPDTILADKKNTKPKMIADAKTLEVEADLNMSMNRAQIIAKIKAALEGKAEPEVEVESDQEKKDKELFGKNYEDFKELPPEEQDAAREDIKNIREMAAEEERREALSPEETLAEDRASLKELLAVRKTTEIPLRREHIDNPTLVPDGEFRLEAIDAELAKRGLPGGIDGLKAINALRDVEDKARDDARREGLKGEALEERADAAVEAAEKARIWEVETTPEAEPAPTAIGQEVIETIPENLRATVKNIEKYLPVVNGQQVEVVKDKTYFYFTDQSLSESIVHDVPRLSDMSVRQWVADYYDKVEETGYTHSLHPDHVTDAETEVETTPEAEIAQEVEEALAKPKQPWMWWSREAKPLDKLRGKDFNTDKAREEGLNYYYKGVLIEVSMRPKAANTWAATIRFDSREGDQYVDVKNLSDLRTRVRKVVNDEIKHYESTGRYSWEEAPVVEPETAPEVEVEVDETSIEFGSPLYTRANQGDMEEIYRVSDDGTPRKKASPRRDNDEVYLYDRETDDFFHLNDETGEIRRIDTKDVIDLWENAERMPMRVYSHFLENKTFNMEGENVRIITPAGSEKSVNLRKLTTENLDTGEISTDAEFGFVQLLDDPGLEARIEAQIAEVRSLEDDIRTISEGDMLGSDASVTAGLIGGISPLLTGVMADAKSLADALAVGDTGRAIEFANSLRDAIGFSDRAQAGLGIDIREEIDAAFGDEASVQNSALLDFGEQYAEHVEGDEAVHELLRTLSRREFRSARELLADVVAEEGLSVQEKPTTALPASGEHDLNQPLEDEDLEYQAQSMATEMDIPINEARAQMLDTGPLFGPGAANKAEFERASEIREALDRMDERNVPVDDPERLRLIDELEETEPARLTDPPVSFSPLPNEEAERQFMESNHMEVERPNLRERVKEIFRWTGTKMAREHIELDRKDVRWTELSNALRMLGHAKTVAIQENYEDLQDVLDGLTSQQYQGFTKVVVFRDIKNEIDNDRWVINPETGRGPYNLTKEEALEAIETYNEEAALDPAVTRALERREALWTVLREDYLSSMESIGLDFEERYQNKDYFRHQILMYATVKNKYGSRAKLKDLRKSSINIARQGSSLNWNTNYLEAEWDALSQMHHNMEVAKVIKVVMDKHDISDQLKRELKQAVEGQARAVLEADGLDPDLEENADALKQARTDARKGQKWQNMLPEGYELFSPSEGRAMFLTHSIPENIAQELMKDLEKEIGITGDQLQPVRALGGNYRQLAIPKEVAITLRNVSKGGPVDNILMEVGRWVRSSWKRNHLTGPLGFIRYNARNLLGDAEVTFLGNPAGFLYSKQAAGELFDVMFRGAELKGSLRDYFKRGGFGGLVTVSELSDVHQLPGFQELSQQYGGDPRNIPKKAWDGYWKKARLATDWREAILRYANYLSFLQQIETKGKPKSYAASIPEAVEALKDPKDKAYKLANELMGAYDQVSEGGRFLADTGISPFFRFSETNFVRFKRMAHNAGREGNLASFIGTKAVTIPAKVGVYGATAVGAFYLKAQLFHVMTHVFNQMVAGDEDDSLQENVRREPHLTFPGISSKDGRVFFLTRFGVSQEAAEWFGMDALPSKLYDYLNGKRSLEELGKESGSSALSKAFNSVPYAQLGALGLGLQTFPDVMNPRAVKDKFRNLLKFSLPGTELIWDYVRGVPMKPLWQTAAELAAYSVDPREAAYSDTRARKYRWLREVKGKDSGGGYSNKSLALYHAKMAFKHNDRVAEEKYLREYAEYDGTLRGMKQSLEFLSPLGDMSEVEQIEFVQSLDSRETEDLAMAMRWYTEELIGGGFGDVVSRNIDWMGDAFEASEFRLLLQQLAGEAKAMAALETVDALPEGAATVEDLNEDFDAILKGVGGVEGLLERGLDREELRNFSGKVDQVKRKIIKDELLRLRVNKEFEINLPFVSAN